MCVYVCLLVYMCVYVRVCVHIAQCVWVEVRRQLDGIRFLLPSCASQGSTNAVS